MAQSQSYGTVFGVIALVLVIFLFVYVFISKKTMSPQTILGNPISVNEILTVDSSLTFINTATNSGFLLTLSAGQAGNGQSIVVRNRSSFPMNISSNNIIFLGLSSISSTSTLVTVPPLSSVFFSLLNPTTAYYIGGTSDGASLQPILPPPSLFSQSTFPPPLLPQNNFPPYPISQTAFV